jgi:inosine/xanthosine triphosphatase
MGKTDTFNTKILFWKMKILVGSLNPVKIEAVKEAFSLYFNNVEVSGIEVESEVPNQPVGDQTFNGALNRANKLKFISDKENLHAEYFVGIEGGISQIFNKWFAYGCMCVMNKDEQIGFGLSPGFELPPKVVEQLLKGKELGHVMDEIMNEQNTKQRGGAIAFFTNGVMNRKELYVEGLKTAIIPFLHNELFFNK